MKKRQLKINDSEKLQDSVKAALIADAQREFMLIENDEIKDQHQKLLQDIVEFYLSEYVPIIQRHSKMITMLNKLNIALQTRGVYTINQLNEFNHFLDSKLKEMFTSEP